MATTFDSLPFGIQTDDSVPLPQQELLYSVRPIPFSNAVVLDISGLTEYRFAGTIRILPAALASWRARLGQTKTLVLEDATYANATLVGLQNIRRLPHNDYVWLEAEWIFGS